MIPIRGIRVTGVTMTNAKPARLVYHRGFPYGAPMVSLRGGATKIPEVRETLKGAGFYWDGAKYAWSTAMHRDELTNLLITLRDTFMLEVVPSASLREDYVLDLSHHIAKWDSQPPLITNLLDLLNESLEEVTDGAARP